MKNRLWKAGLIIGLSVCLWGCGKKEEAKRYNAEFLTLFNTVTQITGYAENEEDFKEQVQEFYNELYEYHRLYDIYTAYEGLANLKTVNDNAGIAPVKVDKKIIDMLLFGTEMYEKTKGRVNIAYGSVLSVWHQYRTKGLESPEQARLPELKELKRAEQFTDINGLVIDKEAQTVFLKDASMSLDVGAVGKGYAVEQVCRKMQEKGISRWLVSVGGNIRAIGSREGGTPWKAGIQNPDKESDKPYLYKVGLQDEALVTSGDYQRYYVVDGVRYHHIIDPATLMPSAYFTAVSIVCPDSGMADALSTAVYNMSFKEGLAYIEKLDGVEAMWVFADESVKFSSGFEKYIVK